MGAIIRGYRGCFFRVNFLYILVVLSLSRAGAGYTERPYNLGKPGMHQSRGGMEGIYGPSQVGQAPPLFVCRCAVLSSNRFHRDCVAFFFDAIREGSGGVVDVCVGVL